MNRLADFTKKLWQSQSGGVITLLYALLNAAIIYYCLELGNKNPFMNGVLYTAVNILTVFTVQSAFFLIFQRWWIASLCTSVPLVLLSTANYYTLLYRNLPISTQDIHNAGTTLSVIDSYSFPINVYVAAIAVFFALSLAVTWVLRSRERGRCLRLKGMAVKNTCLLLFCVIFVRTVYMGENPLKPKNTFVWSWEDSYYTYGYAASSVEILQKSIKLVDMPEGYSQKAAAELAESTQLIQTAENTPDIILILNETFYDLRDIADIDTDIEVTPFTDRLKAVRGRAVVAGTGGGTNKSEYELLTSNSLQLMPGITPFNYLDFNNANSVVSYLRGLGYSTWAAHCASSTNYSRGNVYPKLGFDRMLFKEDFGKTERFGSRNYATDSSCYARLIEEYESMTEGPRFMYMLTIQNHGGWDSNPESEDIVHIKNDLGEYTDEVNEFLSCMALSDKAFEELVGYFSAVERPVVVCMVGDHSPAFAVEMIDKSDMNRVFSLRSTPYIIWSNFDMEDTPGGTISMPYLVPAVLKGAGCPMSGFYSYMLRLREEVPVLTAFNMYETAEGERYEYSEKTAYTDKINDYFKLVYNNAADRDGRIRSFFEAQR